MKILLQTFRPGSRHRLRFEQIASDHIISHVRRIDTDLKTKKTDRQHLCISRENAQIFLAACVLFTGPVYAFVIWLTIVTGRRISEALQLQGSDTFLSGGTNHDHPHIYFAVKDDHKGVPGMSKLAGAAVARLSPDAVEEIQELANTGLEWKVMPALVPHRAQGPHPLKQVLETTGIT